MHESTEIVYKYYARALKDLFEKNALKRSLYGQKQTMCLEELIVLF